MFQLHGVVGKLHKQCHTLIKPYTT